MVFKEYPVAIQNIVFIESFFFIVLLFSGYIFDVPKLKNKQIVSELLKMFS